MAMSKDELKAAFREGYSREFDNIPLCESAISLDISTHFENKMNLLILKQNKASWHWFNTSYKKAMVLAAALMLMITMTFSVSAIRKPIVEFFVEIYETFSEFLFIGDTTDKVSIEYSFVDNPKDFEIINYYKDENSIQTTYKNTNGDVLELCQTITEDTNYSLDIEKGNSKIIVSDGRKINLYSQLGFTQAIWIETNCLITLTYEGYTTEETIIQLINSIKATNN